jgi:hypothetical protein
MNEWGLVLLVGGAAMVAALVAAIVGFMIWRRRTADRE